MIIPVSQSITLGMIVNEDTHRDCLSSNTNAHRFFSMSHDTFWRGAVSSPPVLRKPA